LAGWLSLLYRAVAGHKTRKTLGNGVGANESIRGLHSVTMVVRSLGHTLELMTGLLARRFQKIPLLTRPLGCHTRERPTPRIYRGRAQIGFDSAIVAPGRWRDGSAKRL